jgi:hypothetical protein
LRATRRRHRHAGWGTLERLCRREARRRVAHGAYVLAVLAALRRCFHRCFAPGARLRWKEAGGCAARRLLVGRAGKRHLPMLFARPSAAPHD